MRNKDILSTLQKILAYILYILYMYTFFAVHVYSASLFLTLG